MAKQFAGHWVSLRRKPRARVCFSSLPAQVGKPEHIRLTAQWRTQRKSKADLILHMLQNNVPISPMLSIPWVDQDCWRVDWLHACDMGVSADYIGQLFYRLIQLKKLSGETQAKRADSLFKKLNEWYEQNPDADRIHSFSMLTIKSKKAKLPRMKCQAAVLRHMVPFAKMLAEECCDMANPEQAAMKHGMVHLWQCYMCLRSGSIKGDALMAESTKFILQYAGLQEMTPTVFRLRPKSHQLLELGLEASEGGEPETCWTYRDEDFGGTGSHFAKRRGSVLTVKSFSIVVMTRFFSQPFIRIT